MPLTLTTTELAAVVFVAVALAATDAAALSRLFVAVLAKKLGVKPSEIMRYDNATDGNDTDSTDAEGAD
jgi:hypothetical protein